jgi:hypothetical protein
MNLDDGEIELLARAYHERYRVSAGATAPGARPWDDLSEDLREANRASVRAAVGHLESLGLGVRRVGPGGQARAVELDGALVERGARLEHDRWCAQRRASGVVHGDERDDSRSPPTHPDLVPWEDLDEPAREKDRVRIRAIPDLLAAIGIEVTGVDGDDG